MDTCIYKHIDINIYGLQVTFLYIQLPFKFSKNRNCFTIRKKFFKEGIIFSNFAYKHFLKYILCFC